jgi:hypothetical protein
VRYVVCCVLDVVCRCSVVGAVLTFVCCVLGVVCVLGLGGDLQEHVGRELAARWVLGEVRHGRRGDHHVHVVVPRDEAGWCVVCVRASRMCVCVFACACGW